jgi:hypothetical protein
MRPPAASSTRPVTTNPNRPINARELLTGVVARADAEDSATGTIRTTRQGAIAFPDLVARYQHAWKQAAKDALYATAKAALTAAARCDS